MMLQQATDIRNYIIEQVGQYPNDIVNVCMAIHRESPTKLIDVFNKYQNANSLSFNRTEILVKLSQFGDTPLISRSQAKRIIIDLEKFQDITLDFSGVRLVGQGFVDEMFRVFANLHPEITIQYVNANPDVRFMIERGLPYTPPHTV